MTAAVATMRERCSSLLLAVPFALYSTTVWHYSVNVPYWDDFSVILRPVAAVFSADTLRGQLAILSAPNAGHLPLLTRLVAVLQVWLTGAIDFRQSILAANLGWLLATALLLGYARRQWQLRGSALLPIPLLMLSVIHWEAMDFATPAWQMYWGSALLPLLALLAAVHGRWPLAGCAYAVALFFSSGALALLPMLGGYALYRRQWRQALPFGLLALAATALFLAINTPQVAQGAVALPAWPVALAFVPAFLGNVISNGSWILSHLAWLHIALGIGVLAAGALVLYLPARFDAAKLVFCYVLALAAMAVYLRGGEYPWVVSRYAPFALLNAATLYAALAGHWQQLPAVPSRPLLAAAIALATALWLHSYHRCLATLADNRALRLAAATQYLQAGLPGEKLLWDVHYGATVLHEARAAGVFDSRVWEGAR